MNTFSGKRPRDKDMPYLSTSSYLRQMAGTEKPGKNMDPTGEAFLLTHTFNIIFTMCWDRQACANCVDPDQIPQNVASDQGLHCLPLI